jgi:pimeloyl-ACP methyl ester carboxylesterase
MATGAFRSAPNGTLEAKHDPSLYETWPFRDEDHWAALDQVVAPTLLIRAQATFVRAEAMAKMRDRLSNASLVQFEDTVHVIPVDSPIQLADAFTSFFGAITVDMRN